MSTQRPQKWLFPVGSGHLFHLAERVTEPRARCGMEPKGDGNGLFWIEKGGSPLDWCSTCEAWLDAHPQPAWTPGPPTQEGPCWAIADGKVLAGNVLSDGEVLFFWNGPEYVWMEDISHHIPLQKPEAP